MSLPEIRPMAAEELPALAALHAAAFPADPWDAKSLARLAALPGALCLVAGRPPAGFLLARAAADEAEVLTLAVSPAFRRRGLGGGLLAGLAGRLAALGCRRLFLEVAADNAAARALYGRAGFTEVGRRAGYYQPPGDETTAADAAPKGVDALVLALGLE